MLFKSIVWDYIGKFGRIVSTLVITAILSRLLTPAEYGTMGIILAITALSSIFLEFGFTSGIVQQKEIETIQLNTIFFLVLTASILVYTIFFFLSPLIANFYQQPILKNLIRVNSIIFIINSCNTIPNSLILKKMMFKEQSIRNILLNIIIGSIAVVVAFLGYGVWALVLQTILTSLSVLLINLWLTKWSPKVSFSISSIESILSYSKYLFYSVGIHTFYARIDSIVIGKLIDIPTLGLYTRAKGMENIVNALSTSSINEVMFPYLSKIQNDLVTVKKIFFNFFHLISVLIFLITGLAYINAPWLFDLLFGSQWDKAATYYQIISLGAFTASINGLIISTFNSTGHSKLFFQTEVWKKFLITLTFITLFWGLEFFLYAMVFSSIIGINISFYFLNKAIGIAYINYIKQMYIYLSITLSYLIVINIIIFSVIDLNIILTSTISSILFIIYFFFFLKILMPSPFNLVLTEGINLYKSKISNIVLR